MSQYTPEEIIDLIERAGGPEKLDLSGKDLSGIDLSRAKIQALAKLSSTPNPVWLGPETGGVNLAGANFQEAWLEGANLQGAWLGNVNLQGAQLLGANLQGAWLENVNLQNAYLLLANLVGADLAGANLQNAYLVGANLQDTGLGGANLQDTKLWGANLERADLRGAKLEGAFFYRARLEHTRILELPEFIGEEREGKWEEARHAYTALKVNLRNLGYYDQARKAYVKERHMERQLNCPWRGAQWGKAKLEALPQGSRWRRGWLGAFYRRWLYGVAFLGWLWNWLLDFFTEYMENPLRVAVRLALPVPLLFAFLYWLGGGLTYIEDGKNLPPLWWEYIIFSLRTLPTLAFSDLQPVGVGRWLSAFEGMLGVGLFALFIYTLGRRVAGY